MGYSLNFCVSKNIFLQYKINKCIMLDLTCRVCLQTEELMVNIFEEVEDKQYDLSNLLEQCGGLTAYKADQFPQYLCRDCTTELLIAAKFREKCSRAKALYNRWEAAQAREIDEIKVDIDDETTVLAHEDPLELENEEPFEEKWAVEAQISELHHSDNEINTEITEVNTDDTKDIIEDIDDFIEYNINETDKFGEKQLAQPPIEEEKHTETEDQDQLLESLVEKEKFTEDQDQDLDRLSETSEELLTYYDCDVCGACFTHAHNLDRHFRTLHPQKKTHYCENCRYTCSSLKRYHHHTCKIPTKKRCHMKPKHPRRLNIPRPRIYPCGFCGKKVPSQAALNMHLRTHTGERPYECPECNKAFKTHCALKTHLKRHTGKPDYACPVCGRTFFESSNLNSHMRVHTGERPHKCQYCGKKFTRIFLLQLHMRIHTGEKPYMCNICGRTFTQLGDLKSHTSVHTGKKPIQCPSCPKSYHRHKLFMVHWERHHPQESRQPMEKSRKTFSTTIETNELNIDEANVSDDNLELDEIIEEALFTE